MDPIVPLTGSNTVREAAKDASAALLGNGCPVLPHEVERPSKSRGDALLGNILKPNCSSSVALCYVANDWATECNKRQRKEKLGKLI